MSSYTKMKNQYQAAVDNLPFFFAFREKQFAEGMAKFGLKPEETDKIYRMGSTGGFYLKTDALLIQDTFMQHELAHMEAMDADSTGEGYIYEMFFVIFIPRL